MQELTPRDVARLRNAIAHVGTAAFFPAFRKLLRARMPFSTFLLMRFDPGKPPALLESWFKTHEVRTQALRDYVDTTYPFDPFFQFRDLPPKGGLYRINEIAPDRFFSSEYYLQYYRATGLCDEVGLLAPLPLGATAHLSVSRFETAGPYRRREIKCLKHYAPILLELLTQHCAANVVANPQLPHAELPSLPDAIRSHAREKLGTPLTHREGQIAALVLQGHSNGSAALSLGIARETCKVHRRNLYRKLTISSQRELFGLLKHLL